MKKTINNFEINNEQYNLNIKTVDLSDYSNSPVSSKSVNDLFDNILLQRINDNFLSFDTTKQDGHREFSGTLNDGEFQYIFTDVLYQTNKKINRFYSSKGVLSDYLNGKYITVAASININDVKNISHFSLYSSSMTHIKYSVNDDLKGNTLFMYLTTKFYKTPDGIIAQLRPFVKNHNEEYNLNYDINFLFVFEGVISREDVLNYNNNNCISVKPTKEESSTIIDSYDNGVLNNIDIYEFTSPDINIYINKTFTIYEKHTTITTPSIYIDYGRYILFFGINIINPCDIFINDVNIYRCNNTNAYCIEIDNRDRRYSNNIFIKIISYDQNTIIIPFCALYVYDDMLYNNLKKYHKNTKPYKLNNILSNIDSLICYDNLYDRNNIINIIYDRNNLETLNNKHLFRKWTSVAIGSSMKIVDTKYTIHIEQASQDPERSYIGFFCETGSEEMTILMKCSVNVSNCKNISFFNGSYRTVMKEFDEDGTYENIEFVAHMISAGNHYNGFHFVPKDISNAPMDVECTIEYYVVVYRIFIQKSLK